MIIFVVAKNSSFGFLGLDFFRGGKKTKYAICVVGFQIAPKGKSGRKKIK